MNLRPLYSFGLIGIAAIQADCVLTVCHEGSCEKNFSILSWCATSKACRVNGQLFTACEETSPCLLTIAPGTHYEVPFDKLRPFLGPRNDLGFQWNRDFKDEATVAVFFDDVPATEEQCKRGFQANHSYVTCRNVPPDLGRLEFDFIPPKAGVSGNIAMSVGMDDTECAAAHAGECN